MNYCASAIYIAFVNYADLTLAARAPVDKSLPLFFNLFQPGVASFSCWDPPRQSGESPVANNVGIGWQQCGVSTGLDALPPTAKDNVTEAAYPRLDQTAISDWSPVNMYSEGHTIHCQQPHALRANTSGYPKKMSTMAGQRRLRLSDTPGSSAFTSYFPISETHQPSATAKGESDILDFSNESNTDRATSTNTSVPIYPYNEPQFAKFNTGCMYDYNCIDSGKTTRTILESWSTLSPRVLSHLITSDFFPTKGRMQLPTTRKTSIFNDQTYLNFYQLKLPKQLVSENIESILEMFAEVDSRTLTEEKAKDSIIIIKELFHQRRALARMTPQHTFRLGELYYIPQLVTAEGYINELIRSKGVPHLNHLFSYFAETLKKLRSYLETVSFIVSAANSAQFYTYTKFTTFCDQWNVQKKTLNSGDKMKNAVLFLSCLAMEHSRKYTPMQLEVQDPRLFLYIADLFVNISNFLIGESSEKHEEIASFVDAILTECCGPTQSKNLEEADLFTLIRGIDTILLGVMEINHITEFNVQFAEREDIWGGAKLWKPPMIFEIFCVHDRLCRSLKVIENFRLSKETAVTSSLVDSYKVECMLRAVYQNNPFDSSGAKLCEEMLELYDAIVAKCISQRTDIDPTNPKVLSNYKLHSFLNALYQHKGPLFCSRLRAIPRQACVVTAHMNGIFLATARRIPSYHSCCRMKNQQPPSLDAEDIGTMAMNLPQSLKFAFVHYIHNAWREEFLARSPSHPIIIEHARVMDMLESELLTTESSLLYSDYQRLMAGFLHVNDNIPSLAALGTLTISQLASNLTNIINQTKALNETMYSCVMSNFELLRHYYETKIAGVLVPFEKLAIKEAKVKRYEKNLLEIWRQAMNNPNLKSTDIDYYYEEAIIKTEFSQLVKPLALFRLADDHLKNAHNPTRNVELSKIPNQHPR